MHALAHGTGKSRIGVLAADGQGNAQPLRAYLSINHGPYSEIILGGSDAFGETHSRSGESNLASRYQVDRFPFTNRVLLLAATHFSEITRAIQRVTCSFQWHHYIVQLPPNHL